MVGLRLVRPIAAVALGALLASCAGASIGGTIPSGATSQRPRHQQVATLDVETAANEQALVHDATLIVVGTPIGKAREVPTSQEPEGPMAVQTFSAYYHTVKVHQVLRGATVGDTIQVVRGGMSSAAKNKGIVSADGGMTVLPNGKHIFFLQPSAQPEVFQIVGYWSGALQLDANERVKSDRQETKGFDGLDIATVEKKIVELASTQ